MEQWGIICHGYGKYERVCATVRIAYMRYIEGNLKISVLIIPVIGYWYNLKPGWEKVFETRRISSIDF